MRRIKKETKQAALVQQETMANKEENCALTNYVMPVVTTNQSRIRGPTIQENNFEIKPAIIQIIQTSIQLSGLPNDDPNAHTISFLEIVGENALKVVFSFIIYLFNYLHKYSLLIQVLNAML